jgi:hypothetical protein
MAQEIINHGITAGDGTGEILFSSFEKCNNNFTELYSRTDIVNNTSITPLTASDLNTAYPSAQNGFRVTAPLTTPNPLVYTKISGGWMSAIVSVL